MHESISDPHRCNPPCKDQQALDAPAAVMEGRSHLTPWADQNEDKEVENKEHKTHSDYVWGPQACFQVSTTSVGAWRSQPRGRPIEEIIGCVQDHDGVANP